MIKNGIHALLTENGVKLEEADRKSLLKKNDDSTILENLDLTPASVLIMNGELELLRSLPERKEKLTESILLAGATFQKQVELLITIRGITPLVAMAFLADIGDINRFSSTRKMNAYLGLVPQCSDSGGKERHGHINRESRKLTRTILTQTLVQVADASPQFRKFYVDLKERRGAGRARIALIRKLCGIMRRMLIVGAEYRDKEENLFNTKISQYRIILGQYKKERKFKKSA
jgi:transposase